MAQYWTALRVLNQVAGELGLPAVTSTTSLADVQSVQLLSLLNSAGNELQLYYPWEQFLKEWILVTTVDVTDYPLPSDYNYFLDQTQWDRSNHWPLLGPQSPQEWAWLRSSNLATLPSLRYRIQGNQFKILPAPGVSTTLAMEYVQSNWVLTIADTLQDMITADTDVLQYDPWLLIKFVKFKFYELKGFVTAGVNGDFMRVFNALTGRDKGAKILSLAPKSNSVGYIGPWSIPDGSWNVGP